jgi:hypothetical protein
MMFHDIIIKSLELLMLNNLERTSLVTRKTLSTEKRFYNVEPGLAINGLYYKSCTIVIYNFNHSTIAGPVL